MANVQSMQQRVRSEYTAGAAMLRDELDEAVAALTAFDASRLEAMEQKIRNMTAERFASSRQMLPEILEKHALLGQLLTVTEANLKVLVSVLNLESKVEMH
jgi:hypothetical protein